MNRLKVNEYFVSLQGEGNYTGYKVLFIRLSGCNLNCSFCDSKYHKNVNYNFTIKQMVSTIKKSKCAIIVWTGGEPLLQYDNIKRVRNELGNNYSFHIETNGVLIPKYDMSIFDYIAFSPKSKNVLLMPLTTRNMCDVYLNKYDFDIKVVTDGETIGMDMIKYATILMPLTTHNKKKDTEIRQRVWNLCIKKNIRYGERVQNVVFNSKKRGI